MNLRLEQRVNYIQESSFDQKRPRSLLYQGQVGHGDTADGAALHVGQESHASFYCY